MSRLEIWMKMIFLRFLSFWSGKDLTPDPRWVERSKKKITKFIEKNRDR